MARPKGDRASTDKRKLAMLRAALEAFSKDGYNGASLKSIAAIVGVTEAALLHHYQTKAGLLEAVLDLRDSQTTEHFAKAVALGVSPAEAWVKMVKSNQANRGLVELYSKLAAEATNPKHPAHAYFMRRHFVTQDALTAIFQDLKDSGKLNSSQSPAQLALEIGSLTDGLQIAWLMNPSIDMVKLQIDFFQDCMTNEGFEEIFRQSELSGANELP